MDPNDHLSQNIVFEGKFKELNPHGKIKRILRLKISEQYVILCNMDKNRCKTEQVISLSDSELRVLDKTRKRIALNLLNQNSMIFELSDTDAASKKNWENIILLINKLSYGSQSGNIGKRVLIAENIVDSFEKASKQLLDICSINEPIVFEYYFVELNLKGQGMRQVYIVITNKQVYFASQNLHDLTLNEQIPLGNIDMFVMNYLYKRIGIYLTGSVRIFEMCNNWQNNKTHNIWLELVKLINYKEKENKTNISGGGIALDLDISNDIENFPKKYFARSDKYFKLDFDGDEDSIEFSILKYISVLIKCAGISWAQCVISQTDLPFAGVSWNTSLETGRVNLLRRCGSCPTLYENHKVPLKLVKMAPHIKKSSSSIYIYSHAYEGSLFTQCSHDENTYHSSKKVLLDIYDKVIPGYVSEIETKKMWLSQKESRMYKSYINAHRRYSHTEEVDVALLISRSIKKIDSGDDPDSEESIRYSICKQKYPRKEDCYLPNFTDIKAEQLAFELTYVTKTLILRIRAEDLIHFQKRHLRLKYSNNSVAVLMTFCDQVISMVITEIINQTNVQNRLRTMKYFLQVACVCWKLQNFNTVGNIVTAFRNPVIFHWGKTWSLFKAKYPFTYDLHQKLTWVFYGDNFRSYRNVLRKAVKNPPYIPWVFHFLRHVAIPSWSTYVHTWKKIKRGASGKIHVNEHLHYQTATKMKYKTSKLSHFENASVTTPKIITNKEPEPLKSRFCKDLTWRAEKNVATNKDKNKHIGPSVITTDMLKSVKLRKVPKEHIYNEGSKKERQKGVEENPQRSAHFNELRTWFDGENSSRHSSFICSQAPIDSVKNIRSSNTYHDSQLQIPAPNSATDIEDIYQRTCNEYLSSEWSISTCLNANTSCEEDDCFRNEMRMRENISQTRQNVHLHKDRKSEELLKKKGKNTGGKTKNPKKTKCTRSVPSSKKQGRKTYFHQQ
eukprot:XP_014768912.1 PREDICTED: uncharacterized protein LOC106868254 isoform X2 [Octopus bimaculoides]